MIGCSHWLKLCRAPGAHTATCSPDLTQAVAPGPLHKATSVSHRPVRPAAHSAPRPTAWRCQPRPHRRRRRRRRPQTVQDQLGHASIVLTADTYTSVLPAAQHKAAEATSGTSTAAYTSPDRHQPRPDVRHADPTKTSIHPNSRSEPSYRPSPESPTPRNAPSDNERPASVHEPQGTITPRETAGQEVGRRGLEPRT
jgi:hypothetical protein